MNNYYAHWDAPPNVVALTTTRTPGFSLAPFDQNNLGLHVGDNPMHVHANRAALQANLQLPNSPSWLSQTHSIDCIIVEQESNRDADAAITRQPKNVLAVMTADCQPLLLCNKQGTEIAAIHAGWRGLVNGIIENTLAKMRSKPADILAWIGPAICPSCYEVGDEVRELFVSHYPFADAFFQPQGEKWLINLAGITNEIFKALSVIEVFPSSICTFEQKNDFYSYRREQQTGRMASLIWLNK